MIVVQIYYKTTSHMHLKTVFAICGYWRFKNQINHYAIFRIKSDILMLLALLGLK